MRPLVTSILLMLAVALVPRPAPAAGATGTLMPDIDFIPVAANWAFTGTRFNDLAEKQAGDPKVKALAGRATREYNQAINKLTTIAVNMSLEIAPQLLATQQPKLEQLAALKGAEFDRAYVKQLIEIQEELVNIFEAKAKDAADPELKTYTAKVLPALKEQLKEVKALAETPTGPPARSQITLVVPADAEVLFDGHRTTQKGTERLYTTPPLQVGKKFHYEVVVRWTKDGKPAEEKRTIEVPGGGTVRVDFTRPAATGGNGQLSEEEAFALGTEAYIFGYPLLTMDATRRVSTNVPAPEGSKAPMGQFANAREYPTAAFKDVTAPNADTLYSTAWLDLAKEPWVLHVPDEGDRYYLMPMLSGWTNVFADPGKRTTGTNAGDFAITGPGWKGTLPDGVKQLQAPTNMVWVLGRTYCTGTPEDYKAVHAVQDKYALTPLSAWGKPYTPPAKVDVDPMVDTKTPPREQVNAMDAGTYFKKLAALMKDNPPAEADAPMVAKLAKFGIVAGKDFDIGKLDPAAAMGLQRAAKAGLEQIVAEIPRVGKKVNGWQITFTGNYGTDYLFRATVAFVGLGANRAQDACYPMTGVDADGKPLDGANRYVVHFASKDELPPVNGFWSLTMYNAEYFFVANPLNRYTLSERNKLQANADGSIDLYVQKDSPGKEKEANWLPAPEGKFNLMLRLYWPKEAFLDGSWKPPAVKKVAP